MCFCIQKVHMKIKFTENFIKTYRNSVCIQLQWTLNMNIQNDHI